MKLPCYISGSFELLTAMQIRILGCSGGIGPGLRTTSLLVDGTLLIDAGTGVGDLPAAELAAIGVTMVDAPLSRSDQALYGAKEHGRNRIECL